MKETVNKHRFMDRFQEMDRYQQFNGYEGLSALYDYLTDYEESTGEDIELDVIALCCEFTHYDSIDEVKKNYDRIKDLDDLKNNTQVIEFGDGELIIQNF